MRFCSCKSAARIDSPRQQILKFLNFLVGRIFCMGRGGSPNPPASYRSGPKSQKSLKKVSRGPPAPASPKVWKMSGKVSKKSEKSGKSLENVCSGLCRESRLFPDFWGPRGLFSDSFGISGPEGPRDSCSSREGSQVKTFRGATESS